MLMRVLESLSKFSFQLVICPNPASPTIMKLHERDIGVAKESVQSANHIEFLGKIIQGCSRYSLGMELRDEVFGEGLEKEE